MVNFNSSRPIADGFQRSQRGNLYSPAVKGALNALAKQQFPGARAMRGSVQKAMLVENIAAKFATDGNMETMKDSFKRLIDNDNYEQSQPQKQQRLMCHPMVDPEENKRHICLMLCLHQGWNKIECFRMHLCLHNLPDASTVGRMLYTLMEYVNQKNRFNLAKGLKATQVDGVCDVFRGIRVSDAS